MLDLSNFVDYPLWFKCAVIVWLVLSLFIGVATIAIKKPNSESEKYILQTKENRSDNMDGKMSPINAPNSVISINQQGGQTAQAINNITVNSSDRIIPQNIMIELNNILRNRVGKASIKIANNEMQGQEPVRFAEMLNNLFLSSGWESSVSNSHNMIANGVVPTGLTINAIGQSNAQLANFICQKLSSIGIRSSYKVYDSDDNLRDLFVEVWTK